MGNGCCLAPWSKPWSTNQKSQSLALQNCLNMSVQKFQSRARMHRCDWCIQASISFGFSLRVSTSCRRLDRCIPKTFANFSFPMQINVQVLASV